MKYICHYKKFENTLLNLKDNTDFEIIKRIQLLLPDGGNILEISCGNGADSIELKNQGYNVIATDINEKYVKLVNDFLPCIKHDTLDKFPFHNNQFDLVFSRLGLHYFEYNDLINIFDEIYRITNKYLFFTVKLVNDIPTGKVILDEKTWKKLVSKKFQIINSEIKTGVLYNNESKWIEITAIKKI